MCWMKANRIDPSLAVGFKFSNYEEFESWTQVNSHHKLRAGSSVRKYLETIIICRNLELFFRKLKKKLICRLELLRHLRTGWCRSVQPLSVVIPIIPIMRSLT